ncbi:hypothetical protein ET445_03840 [Agromyces protaetiae]|uniref:DNA helicase n=1 Tax=Agromyces protaetiae TaxID=2509455 RepID=A0A4P6F9Z2_9MICO|nr:hypothetical protein [Agromyces protaetiae]QAY72604.1 hypothetical protein ET445_03840 [Agromyces protaetiae]
MSLSRKRKKELNQLRKSAEDLWSNQQTVLAHANSVAQEASRQLGHLTREEVAPRVRTGYETYVRPSLDQAKGFARAAGDTAEKTLGTALGSILAVGDLANDVRVQRAVARVSPRTAAAIAPEKKRGFGAYLAIGAGVLAAAGVAYAVWQTFRADDELWVADDEPPTAGAAS